MSWLKHPDVLPAYQASPSTSCILASGLKKSQSNQFCSPNESISWQSPARPHLCRCIVQLLQAESLHLSFSWMGFSWLLVPDTIRSYCSPGHSLPWPFEHAGIRRQQNRDGTSWPALTASAPRMLPEVFRCPRLPKSCRCKTMGQKKGCRTETEKAEERAGGIHIYIYARNLTTPETREPSSTLLHEQATSCSACRPGVNQMNSFCPCLPWRAQRVDNLVSAD